MSKLRDDGKLNVTIVAALVTSPRNEVKKLCEQEIQEEIETVHSYPQISTRMIRILGEIWLRSQVGRG